MNGLVDVKAEDQVGRANDELPLQNSDYSSVSSTIAGGEETCFSIDSSTSRPFLDVCFFFSDYSTNDQYFNVAIIHIAFSLIFSKSLSCIKTLKLNRKLDSSMNPNIVFMVIDSSRQSFLFYSQNIVQGKCLNIFVPLMGKHFSYIDKKLLL